MHRLIVLFSFFLLPLFGKPEVVVFDYGGVVAKVDRKPVLLFLSEKLSLPYDQIKEDFAGEKLYASFNQPHEFWEKYAKQSLPKSWMLDLENHKREIVTPTPGMEALILSLKSQGIQVALLSNTNAHRARFLDAMGGYRFFDPIILSCFAGFSKPNPHIYHILFKSLGTSPERCLFVDNKPKNVAQAKELGMDGIVFTSVEELRKDMKKQGLRVQ